MISLPERRSNHMRDETARNTFENMMHESKGSFGHVYEKDYEKESEEKDMSIKKQTFNQPSSSSSLNETVIHSTCISNVNYTPQALQSIKTRNDRGRDRKQDTKNSPVSKPSKSASGLFPESIIIVVVVFMLL